MKRRRKRLMVIIPFSTMTSLADNVLDVTMFYASGADEDSLEPAENAFTELLMERFEQDEDAFFHCESVRDHGSHVWCHQHHVSDDRCAFLACIWLTRQHPGSLLMRFGIPAKKKFNNVIMRWNFCQNKSRFFIWKSAH